MWPCTSRLAIDPSRRQEVNFLREKIVEEKVRKSELEGNLRGIEDVESVREYVKEHPVEVDKVKEAGELKNLENIVAEIGFLKK